MNEERNREGNVAPAMTPQQRRFTSSAGNPLALYRELSVGDAPWATFLGLELAQLLFGNVAGIVGLGFRSIAYRHFFKRCGGRPALGRGLTIRVPGQISLGSGVVIDDYAALDIRGADGAISIADRVSIGRFSSIVAKHGLIELGRGVNVGSYCRIATESRVIVGASTLIAAYAYIGPGNHQVGTEDRPLIERSMENRGGVTIGSHCWIGAHATIMDGVSLGNNVIVGAHSLVRDTVSDNSVVAGTPAKIIKKLNDISISTDSSASVPS